MKLAILIASGAINIILALLVYAKNSRQAVNLAFAGLNLSLVGASFSTYLSLHQAEPLPYIRLTMIFAVALVVSFKWFSNWFPSRQMPFNRTRWLELAAAALVAIIMLLPITFSGVTIHDNGNVAPSFGPGIAAFLLLFIYMVGGGLAVLISRFKRSLSIERAQLRYVLVATIFLFTALLISNLIVPLTFKLSLGVALTPIYFALFAAIIAIAIVKQQLFDIRMIVARSMAYGLLLASLVVIYAILFFGLSSTFLSGENLSVGYQVVNVAIAVILAFTFPYLKRFFDRLTDKIFYRDSYDPQTLMNGINHVLVSTPHLRPMLERASGLIRDTLKVAACVLVVREPETGRQMVVGASHRSLTTAEIEGLLTSLNQKKQFRVDDLTADDESWEIMSDRGFALVSRLGAKYGANHQGVLGFVALGAKLSGNNLSRMDEETIDVISGELAIAVQSAFHFEQIQSFNDTLQQRVGDETRKLRQVNEKLRQLDETKDDFISMASHQLRTPLTSVKGYLSMVLEGDTGRINATQRKMLSQAYTSSQRMVYLIADLLNASRLKTGKFAIEAAPVDLAEVVTSEMDQLIEAAKAKEIDLQYSGPKQLPKLMLDEMKTRQAIMNFVDNAIYYTPPGGKINVKLAETNYAIELRVVDNGIGVPASERHHMFTKFYRAKNAQKARPDGTGLGLFMAKKVIVAEGGSVIFDSEEGKGSTFGFSFPKSKLAS